MTGGVVQFNGHWEKGSHLLYSLDVDQFQAERPPLSSYCGKVLSRT